ncbi:MAG: hypothetical protein HOK65_12795 [Crocinitomicaceae bacterium]|nr:hypothetical protein [Crocinitomicaceae bacterium]
MDDITLFTLGSFIFISYMFFLVRMVWRQHQIQEGKNQKILKVNPTQQKDKES